MPKHPDKSIREAIAYAERHGWTFSKASGQAHIFGKLYCPAPGGCLEFVHSTPRNPQAHARRLCRAVDRCPH